MLSLLQQWSVFSNKFEDALPNFETAANNYKIAKCCAPRPCFPLSQRLCSRSCAGPSIAGDEAGNAFERMSHCNLKMGDEFKHDAAQNLVDASNAYRKSDGKKATECLEQATNTFLEMGRMAIAAKHFKEMGEIAENEQDDASALDCYERAADLYKFVRIWPHFASLPRTFCSTPSGFDGRAAVRNKEAQRHSASSKWLNWLQTKRTYALVSCTQTLGRESYSKVAHSFDRSLRKLSKLSSKLLRMPSALICLSTACRCAQVPNLKRNTLEHLDIERMCLWY